MDVEPVKAATWLALLLRRRMSAVVKDRNMLVWKECEVTWCCRNIKCVQRIFGGKRGKVRKQSSGRILFGRFLVYFVIGRYCCVGCFFV